MDAPRPPTGDALRSTLPSPPRRAPLINRGTATRVAAVDAALDAFLAAAATAAAAAAAATPAPTGSAPPPQVLSLGAGFDTRPACHAPAGVVYVEVDFPTVAAAKWHRLRGGAAAGGSAARPTAALAALPANLSPVPCADGEFHVAGTYGGGAGAEAAAATAAAAGGGGGGRGAYALLGGDLRDAGRLVARLSADGGGGVGWDWAAPTLLLAELVLVYMEPGESGALLAAVAAAATGCLAVVDFEQVRVGGGRGVGRRGGVRAVRACAAVWAGVADAAAPLVCAREFGVTGAGLLSLTSCVTVLVGRARRFFFFLLDRPGACARTCTFLCAHRFGPTTRLACRWSPTLRTGGARCAAWRPFPTCRRRCGGSGAPAGLPSRPSTCALFTTGMGGRGVDGDGRWVWVPHCPQRGCTQR